MEPWVSRKKGETPAKAKKKGREKGIHIAEV